MIFPAGAMVHPKFFLETVALVVSEKKWSGKD